MLFPDLRVFSGYLRFVDAITLLIGPLLLRLIGPFDDATLEEVRSPAYSAFLVVFAPSFLLICRRLKVYHVRRGETLCHELLALLEASILAAATACLFAEVFAGGLPGAVYVAGSSAGIAVLLAARTAVRILLRGLRTRGRDHRRWLLLGRNPRSAKIAIEALQKPHYGIEIVAVLDPPVDGSPDAVDPGRAFRQEPLAGLPQYEDMRAEFISQLLVREAVDEVVVALPLRRFYDEVSAVFTLCEQAGIPVKMPTRTFEGASDQKDIVHLGSIPLLTHYSGPVRTLSLSVKRWFDIAVAATGLALTAPAGVLVALAIKLTSEGPLFFRQSRTGLHSRTFTILKFRTMYDGAAEAQAELRALTQTDGPAFKMRRDPRITPVGRFLRKYHLDELPQLWNVLVGDMSLVGPRPLPPEEANGSTWLQRRRLTMQPGMTCLWQLRSDHEMPFERWMDLDLEYIDRWSLWLDLRVLFATLGTVVRGGGW